MFVRVKSTPNSPRKSVQIVQSVRKGNQVSQKIVRYVGIANSDSELEQLKLLAESIKVGLEAEGQGLLFGPEEIARKARPREDESGDYQVNLKDLVEEDRVVGGLHDIYGTLFCDLGYGRILKNPARNESSVRMFKDIVLARIANPVSKRSSVLMLEEDFGIRLNLEYVYRMMDKLDVPAIERLNKASYENTASLLGGKIDVIFFDCTTLYFEAFEEDEFRELGYSKDKKFNQVQVLFALMVTEDGLPIGYEAYEGSKYEGHTLIPALKNLRTKYPIGKVVFVADSGMMNEKNILELEKEGFEYIVGQRLRSTSKGLQEKILNLANYVQVEEGYLVARFEDKGRQIIVSYSQTRARKDAYEREKAILKLKERLAKQKSPKEYLSNSSYRKYLKMDSQAKLELNEEKIQAEKAWDGLHGVQTNAKNLSDSEILKQYRNLWQVEEAFRINKHDLKIRPVFHWKPSRVKAHLAIAFTAYSLVKYLEYRVKLQYKHLSPELIRQALVRVQTSVLFDTKKNIRYALPSKMSDHAKKIYHLLNIKRNMTPYIIKRNSPQRDKKM